MTMVNTIDWQSLNGKSLKIIVAEPNNTVIGIDEETGKSYVLHHESPTMFRTMDLEPIKKRGWL